MNRELPIDQYVSGFLAIASWMAAGAVNYYGSKSTLWELPVIRTRIFTLWLCGLMAVAQAVLLFTDIELLIWRSFVNGLTPVICVCLALPTLSSQRIGLRMLPPDDPRRQGRIARLIMLGPRRERRP